MKTVHIQSCLERGEALLKKAESILKDAPFDKVRELAQRVPREVAPPDKAVQIVFAGQYSAGKSSILKVMTREDIDIGAGITTQKVQQLDWYGIKVIDTPGVHTEIRPDHDEITYEAISKADLLVFVVTNELFDAHIAAHFRKLAIEREKAYEMLLVINKMQRHAEGNTPAAQDVIREDLRKVLAPFTPEQLRISFVDAEAALEARAEKDEEFSRIFRKRSGFDDFFDNFNAFVEKKGLAARYTTSLYTLEQVLQEALVTESSDDSDVDALQELLIQQRRVLVNGKTQISQSVENEIQQAKNKIREEGRKVADLIRGDMDSEEVNRKLTDAQERVEKQSNELAGLIEKTIEDSISDLGKRVGQIAESELAKELLSRLRERVQGLNIDQETSSRVRQGADVTRQLGEFLVKHAFNPTNGASLFKLSQYSGTATHSMVKSIGHFFGKSFKPWEAIKWTRTIANAGRVLAVAGTILNIVLQVKEDADADKLEQELRESRAAVRAGFDEAANAIELHFDEETNTYVAETIGQRLEEVDKQLKELRDMKQSRSDLFQELNALLEDTRELISEMHVSYSDSE